MTSTRVCTVRAVGPCGHQTRTPAREHGRACRVRPQESRPTRQSRLSSRWGRQSDPHPPCLPPGQEPTGAAPEGAALSKQPNTPEGLAEALRAALGWAACVGSAPATQRSCPNAASGEAVSPPPCEPRRGCGSEEVTWWKTP